jgi:hypothetical protein
LKAAFQKVLADMQEKGHPSKDSRT